MSVGELSSLFGHRLANLWDAVTNGDDCSSAGGIEIALASCGEDKTSFAAYGLRVRLQEISRKDGVTHSLLLSQLERRLGDFAQRSPQLSQLSADTQVRVTQR